MTIENDPDSAATVGEEAPADAGANPISEPPAQGAPAQEAPAEAGANPEGEADSSLTTTQQTEQQQHSDQQTRPDPIGQVQEQYRSLESRFGRSQRELHEAQQRLQAWGDLDPQQVREMVSRQRKEAEERQLRPFHRRHPEHQRTMDKFRLINEAQEALHEAGDSEELQRFVNRRYAGKFDDSDVRAYREYQQYQQQVQQDLVTDPEEFVRSRVEDTVRAYFDQYEQIQQARGETQQWVTGNKELVDKHAQDIHWAMTHPVRRDVGLALAQAKNQIAELQKQLGRGQESVASAEAQRQALNAQATVTRDGATVPAGDPVAAARKLGLQGVALAEYLQQHG